MKKSSIPNFISTLRIIGTAVMLFVEPFTTVFFLLYTACGVTDALDGAIARATNSTSELGAKLDSTADLLFYAVMLLRIFPVLWERLPHAIWMIVGAAVMIRVISYTFVALRYHRFASLHTPFNKLTGLMVFTVPYLISLPIAVPGCFTVAAAGFLSSVQELMLHLMNRTYAS